VTPNRSCQRPVRNVKRAACAPAACRDSVRVVLHHQGRIFAEQIPHRAARIPLAVTPPLAARVDER